MINVMKALLQLKAKYPAIKNIFNSYCTVFTLI